jgi:hypothetical protein
MEEFVLLGDPALLLPKPNGFALDPTPSEQDLCCPPDDEAQYTINVDQLGTFSEVVTLNLAGAPAGSTVDFSVNSEPPPFTSVLTVGALVGAAAGDYNLVITGTSASMQRSINVSLGISVDVPAGVMLTSPPDGATEVDLMPELVWEESPDADEYDLEIAADPGFSYVVYSATVSEASHTVDTPLGMLSQYYWHVRAVNACGQSGFSATFDFTTVNKLMPASYDMLNGESGSYTYYDDTYDGDGDTGTPLAPLSNGLGDLTDGVIATEH